MANSTTAPAKAITTTVPTVAGRPHAKLLNRYLPTLPGPGGATVGVV